MSKGFMSRDREAFIGSKEGSLPGWRLVRWHCPAEDEAEASRIGENDQRTIQIGECGCWKLRKRWKVERGRWSGLVSLLGN